MRGEKHRAAIFSALPDLGDGNFLGEPTGRDTLNAIGLGAAVLAKDDPDAVLAVLTADHLIEPADDFRRIIEQGFTLAEKSPRTLVTFGISPTGPATGYGYLELGEAIEGSTEGDSPIFAARKSGQSPRIVKRFKEKPPAAVAEDYFRQGPERYLWNSGMFVWRADTLLDCIRRYEPASFEGLSAVAQAWKTPRRCAVLAEIYPALKKISVDFAVMEPASRDAAVRVAAVPMPLRWLDIGSWPSFAQTCPRDEAGNALAARRHLLAESSGCLVASSDAEHLVAAIGCRDLIVIHTPDATLICSAEKAEAIKELCHRAEQQFGDKYT